MKKIMFVVAMTLAAPLLVFARGTETTPAVNQGDSDFAAGKLAIGAKDWKGAIEAFSKAEAVMSGNADVQNYLGYAYRQSGAMEQSFSHYNEALRINPNHRGAHSYIGQAFLRVDKPEQAAEHLASLEKICGKGCEEYQDLMHAIDDYKKNISHESAW